MELYESLFERIKKRRNTELIQVMEYLANPNYTKWKTDAFGEKIDASNIKKRAVKMITRLFPQSEQDESIDSNENVMQEDSQTAMQEDSQDQSMEQQFASIYDQKGAPEDKPVYDFSKVMKYEFSAFEQSGKRSETLENLYEALCTVPPTSVESERAFSTVGLFATKIRSSLADNSIDALLTLRVYFKKQQK